MKWHLRKFNNLSRSSISCVALPKIRFKFKYNHSFVQKKLFLDVDVGHQVPDAGALHGGHLGLEVLDLLLQVGVRVRLHDQLLLHRQRLHLPVEPAALGRDVVQGPHPAVTVFLRYAGQGREIRRRTWGRRATSSPGKKWKCIIMIKYYLFEVWLDSVNLKELWK